MMGPTFSIEVSSSSPPPPSPPPQPSPHPDDNPHVDCVLFKDDGEIAAQAPLISTRIGLHETTDSSSSIGAPDDSDEEEEEDEEVDSGSCSKGAALDSLEDALPIKRGLSNHYTGKSKSFTNLAEVSSCRTVKDLVKPENRFNKRRRILMANKWYTCSNPKSMPLLALVEEEEEAEEGADPRHQQHLVQQDEDDNQSSSSSTEQHNQRPKHQYNNKLRSSFKCYSCFNLTDLQQDEHYQ